MNTLPKISIITVIFNNDDELEHTIKSINELRYSNYEYIIIDGKSTDNTIEIIKKYETNITKWISETDNGLYDAMNKGIKLSKGDYIWFLNAGDQVADTKILTKLFTDSPYYDIYYSDTIVINQNYSTIGLLSNHTHNNAPQNLSWRSMSKGMVVCHQSFIVKKNIVPYFDINYKYSADIDWVIKCLKSSSNTYKSNSIIAKFQIGGISKEYLLPSMKERYYILKNHFGFLKNLLNHIFLLIRYFKKGKKSILKN